VSDEQAAEKFATRLSHMLPEIQQYARTMYANPLKNAQKVQEQ
jgi:hypothetical protein